MREEADNEKLLVRYLLGDLPEEQQLQIEGMFLGDDQQYERLLALEDELFYDYAQGKLSPGERTRFEERFLVSAPNRKRVALASALAQKISEVEGAEALEPPPVADQKVYNRRRSLQTYFNDQRMKIWFSLAALAVMLLVALWLAVSTIRLRNEFDRFRAERMVQEDRLQQQARAERGRAEDLSLKLKREMDENAMLKQELSKIEPQSGQQNLGATLSLVLAPSFSRDRGPGMKKLQIPPGVRLLKLQLNLKGEVDYKFYQALLLTADGAEKWSHDRLTAKPAGSGKAVILSLPSSLLREGDYELRLKGYASDGSLSETGDYYYLSIVR